MSMSIGSKAGMTFLGGNISINSSSTWHHYNRYPWQSLFDNRTFTIRVVQHEWTHNFGVVDMSPGSCAVHCIMDGGHWLTVPQSLNNVWCYGCRGIIFSNINNNSLPWLQ